MSEDVVLLNLKHRREVLEAKAEILEEKIKALKVELEEELKHLADLIKEKNE